MTVDPELERRLDSELDDGLLQSLVRSSDPVSIASARRREARIIVGLIVALLTWIAWMLYRLAAG